MCVCARESVCVSICVKMKSKASQFQFVCMKAKERQIISEWSLRYTMVGF